jgi:HK97 family phage major capsid protein
MTDIEEVVGLARELRETVQDRFGEMERRLRRVESDNPLGYEPVDHNGDGADDAGPVIGLARRDSWAAWAARRGGKKVGSGEFSLGRLVQAMLTGNRSALTEFERQALTEGTDASGGLLVPEALAPTVLDLVRARTAVVQAGATVLPMSSDGLTWPQVIQGATPKWKAELEAMEESNLQFGALRLKAKTLRTKVKMSQELREDATPEGAAAIERELHAAFGLELDKAALYGAGDGTDAAKEPRGVINVPGVTKTPGGAAAPTSYDLLIDAIGAVRAANHEPTAIIESAAVATTLSKMKATDNQPLQPPAGYSDIPTLVTNLAATGGATVAGDAFVAEWPLLVIGVRPQIGIQIRTVEAGLADDFSVSIVAWLRADVGLQDPAGVAVVTGIKK